MRPIIIFGRGSVGECPGTSGVAPGGASGDAPLATAASLRSGPGTPIPGPVLDE